MVRALWQGQVVADSDQTMVVEGNHYFPPDSVDQDALLDSPTKTRCFWKGKARYYNLLVDGAIRPDAAWSYPKPWPLARRIEGYVSFSPGIRIEA